MFGLGGQLISSIGISSTGMFIVSGSCMVSKSSSTSHSCSVLQSSTPSPIVFDQSTLLLVMYRGVRVYVCNLRAYGGVCCKINADQVKQNIAEWLHPVKPIQENNYTSQNEDQILNNLYTQSKKRFFYCIGALLAFTILGCAIFTVSIGCLSTVNREPEDSEWIQIVTGVALLVFVTPLAFSVLFVVPHFFITVVKL